MRALVPILLVTVMALAPATAQGSDGPDGPDEPESAIALRVLSDVPFKVPPADSRPMRLVVANHGDADVVFLAVRDTSVGWKALLDEDEFALRAGAQAEFTMTVAAARDGAKDGRILLRFESRNGEEGLLEIPVVLARDAPGPPPQTTTSAGPSPFAQCMRQAQERVDGQELRGEERRRAIAQAAAECCERYDGRFVDKQCRDLERVRDALATQDHVKFVPFEDGTGFEAYTVDGRLVIERVQYTSTAPDEAEVQRREAGVKWSFADGGLSSLDSPTGLFNAEGTGRLELRFPDDTDLVARGASWHVAGDGWAGVMTGINLTVEDHEVVMDDGRLTFHVTPVQSERRAIDDRVDEAIEKRQVGARVDTKGDPKVFAYDDVDVRVDVPTRPTPNDPVYIEVGANLTEGRTIVVDLDASLFAGKLDLRYYDVVYKDGERHQVEVHFAEADSLEDVMDAGDDGIQPEYWVVRDADGLHLLVSVPSWSVHAITVASLAGFVTQPSVLGGLMAGLVGAGAATAALFWPRRKDE